MLSPRVIVDFETVTLTDGAVAALISREGKIPMIVDESINNVSTKLIILFFIFSLFSFN